MEPTITHVVKRDGSREPLDISKIQKQTSAATQGLKNVSQSELELDAKLNFIDGITSEQIQQILIKTAVDKIDLDKPDWTFVAARLFLFDLTHKVRQAYKQHGYNEITLEAYLAVGKKENRLLSNLGYGYDLTKLQAAIDTKRDYLFNYLGIKTLYDRYLVKDFDKNPIETPQLMFMGIAMFLAQNESPETKTDWAIKFYNTLSTFKFMLATPTLTNARTLKHQLSSCFVGSAPDNIEGIFDSYKEMSLLSKFGGGVGWDFAKIRATGSQIRGFKSAAGGLIPFLKITNDMTIAVDQLGCLERNSYVNILESVTIDGKDYYPNENGDIKINDNIINIKDLECQ
nr:MAG TPA: ribonucleotide-diphosphate reductase subunit alpha [Caudoviricetes sp.]